MAGHTPTPWHLDARDKLIVCYGSGDSICDCAPGSPQTSMKAAKANAAFIVKAVNRDHHFDALVKALEFIRDGYDNYDINHVDYRVKVYQVALDALESLWRPVGGVR